MYSENSETKNTQESGYGTHMRALTHVTMLASNAVRDANRDFEVKHGEGHRSGITEGDRRAHETVRDRRTGIRRRPACRRRECEIDRGVGVGKGSSQEDLGDRESAIAEYVVRPGGVPAGRLVLRRERFSSAGVGARGRARGTRRGSPCGPECASNRQRAVADQSDVSSAR